MSFVMPVFFLFLPVVAVLYRVLPEKLRWMMLLGASLLFYAWHNVWLLGLILGTILVTWLCSMVIDGAESQKEKRSAMVFCAVVCLGVLVIFKYLDFLTGNVLSLARLAGVEIPFSGFGILLPMGISFYVFQTMSYVFDVYRGTVKAEKHLGYYALFVTFFPQLVAGPIERPDTLIPQLRCGKNPVREDYRAAFPLLVRGYAKKVLIADFLSVYVDHAYGLGPEADGSALAAATVFFAFQIYCDFSGYSDIAQGCGRLMGIRLMDNFRRPYGASSIREFWRRWHISLTQWFTDYLYIPLGGSRTGTLRTCRNILITFLVSGLWHGANWTYVIWGGLHGLYLVAERLLCRDRAPGRVVTFSLTCFAWVFFRSRDLGEAAAILGRIFSLWHPGDMLTGLGMGALELMVGILLLCLLPRVEELGTAPGADEVEIYRRQLVYYFLIPAIVICRMLILAAHGDTSFIYFQF